MSLYFFDIHDGTFTLDDDGTECADMDCVRSESKRVLPAIAVDVLPKNGDHHVLTVRVRNEQNDTDYTATLMYNGLSMENVNQSSCVVRRTSTAGCWGIRPEDRRARCEVPRGLLVGRRVPSLRVQCHNKFQSGLIREVRARRFLSPSLRSAGRSANPDS
jgi:hypothetical protein